MIKEYIVLCIIHKKANVNRIRAKFVKLLKIQNIVEDFNISRGILRIHLSYL